MPTRNYGNGKPWRARIRYNGRDLYLGSFDTKEEAERAESKARTKYPSKQYLGWLVRHRDVQGRFIA